MVNTVNNKNVQVKTLYYEMKLINKKRGLEGQIKMALHVNLCSHTDYSQTMATSGTDHPEISGTLQYHYPRHSYLQ